MKKKLLVYFHLIIIIAAVPFAFNSVPLNNNLREDLNLQTSSDSAFIPFEIGVQYGPIDIDPQVVWDSQSFDVIDQVCEGLFTYDLSAPDLTIIPHLASNFGTWSGNNYTVSLRTGVLFHDGTKFNATAVKFTFDRLAYFIDNFMAIASPLYEYYNPNAAKYLPIINKTEIINEYTIKFVLNNPYGPFESLLCFESSFILSPTTTPPTNPINTITGKLVGTGPFYFDSYIPNFKVNLYAFSKYWRGKASIDKLIFSIINDQLVLNNALLNGNIHFLSYPILSMLGNFTAHPNITVLDSVKTSATIRFLGMNNVLINRTFREAISYAINYSYIIDVILNGKAARLRSPIPQGIKYSNGTINLPIFNITHARMIMQSMGFGTTLDPSYPGITELNWSYSIFNSYNYTYIIDNLLGENMLVLLQNDLAKIGIQITNASVPYTDFISKLGGVSGHHRNELQLYPSGWIPDYNDPSNYINPLFTNRTLASNGVQYNGFIEAQQAGRNPFNLWDNVQLLMEESLTETNQMLRETQYNRIQELLIEDMPCAWLYVPMLIHAFDSNLRGFQQNAIDKLDFFACTWEPYKVSPPIDPALIVLLSVAGYTGIIVLYASVRRATKPRFIKRKSKMLKRRIKNDQKLFDIYKEQVINTKDFVKDFNQANELLKTDINELVEIELRPLEYHNDFKEIGPRGTEGFYNAGIYQDEYNELREFIENLGNVSLENSIKSDPSQKFRDTFLFNSNGEQVVFIERDSGFISIFTESIFDQLLGFLLLPVYNKLLQIIKKYIKKKKKRKDVDRVNDPDVVSITVTHLGEDEKPSKIIKIEGKFTTEEIREIAYNPPNQ